MQMAAASTPAIPSPAGPRSWPDSRAIVPGRGLLSTTRTACARTSASGLSRRYRPKMPQLRCVVLRKAVAQVFGHPALCPGHQGPRSSAPRGGGNLSFGGLMPVGERILLPLGKFNQGGWCSRFDYAQRCAPR